MGSVSKEISTMSEDAITALLEIHGEAVWNYAYVLSRSGAVADDIAQETFIRAYKHMNDFRGEATVRTWLLRIARNRWYSYRKMGFVRRVTLRGDVLPDTAAQSAEDEVLEQSLSSDIWRIVLRLPRKHREVLILAAHYGLTMEDLAGTLGISLSAAKSRLMRARRMAGQLWEKELNRE